MAWEQYAEAARKLGPNPFYGVLEPFLPAPGHVLELGFGVGTGVKWWLERGWRVTGVDEDAQMVAETRGLLAPDDQCDLIHADYMSAPWPDDLDVISAVFSLFFIPPPQFSEVWNRIEQKLRPNGLFVGQLLGPNDDWSSDQTTSHSSEEVDDLVSGWEVLHREEVNRDGKTVFGQPKHWHIHHLILRRAAEVDHSV